MLLQVISKKGNQVNLLRNKKKPQITIWHKLIFLSPIFAIILILKSNEWYNEYQLSTNGIETVATITIVSRSGVRDPVEINNIEFEFNYNDSVVKGYTIAKTNNNYALTNIGMPLLIGDEFIVKYVKDNPKIYELKFNKPTKKTIESYINNTTKTLISLNIYATSKEQKSQCDCLSKNILRKYGINGLATIFFNNELIIENILHNSITFKNFINKKKVQELVKLCEK
jgi:hypothetical protein